MTDSAWNNLSVLLDASNFSELAAEVTHEDRYNSLSSPSIIMVMQWRQSMRHDVQYAQEDMSWGRLVNCKIWEERVASETQSHLRGQKNESLKKTECSVANYAFRARNEVPWRPLVAILATFLLLITRWARTLWGLCSLEMVQNSFMLKQDWIGPVSLIRK
jgi:hypothetical protein